ncbi:MAG TPA: hypothetical protein VN939_13165, partial [Chthoniobacterales bacterium]|nr:hypothetical protein [Chthoniobacterales bacterium]
MNLTSFLQRLPATRVLRKTKDSLVAVGAKDRFNQLIRPYGRVLDFQLNTQERTVFASFRLKGEVDALQFWVHEYRLVENKKGETLIVIDGKDIETSREWLTKLIGDQLGRQKILIPEQFSWLRQ